MDLPMLNQSSASPWNDALWMAERAIVLQVLRDDHEVRWTLGELQAEVDDLNPHALRHALDRVLEEGVVVTCGADVLASRCALHLDALGMVSI
jgi:hypothetical protein